MLFADIVRSQDELLQIHRLNRQNLRQNLSTEEQVKEGFVTWLYPLELLEKMNRLAPSIIVKEGNRVAGYALTTLPETRAFHPDLETMFRNLEDVIYKGRPLLSYHFYCMGQICVDRNFRGRGISGQLYRHHKEVYGKQYEFLLTEVSTGNLPSMKAHEKIGFVNIHTYRDAMDEWAVVVWNWRGY